MLDVVALSKILGLPILLVTPYSDALISQIAPAITYLQAHHADVVGWTGVQTEPGILPSHWEAEGLYLAQQYHLHCLGTLPYSPSISVEGMQQGNLIRMTENNIDLLPIQQAIRLLV